MVAGGWTRTAVLALAVALQVTHAVTLFPFRDLWRYSDAGADLSLTPDWQDYFYDDSAWPAGYGEFGAGTTAAFTTLRTAPAAFYFRKVGTAPAAVCAWLLPVPAT